MFTYNIIKTPIFEIKKNIIDNIFLIISNIVEVKQNGTINIVFLDDESIKNLNKTYRKQDKTTDVLSFHYFKDFSNLEKEEIAGEIIMSEEKIIKQGKIYKLGEEKEFYKLLIHSVLHILGYDHEIENDYKMMQNIEEKIWKEVFDK